MNQENQISRKETANILGVTTKSIDRYLRRGWLKSEKIGHNIWINKDDIEEVKKRLNVHLKENSSPQNSFEPIKGVSEEIKRSVWTPSGHQVDTHQNMAEQSQKPSGHKTKEGRELEDRSSKLDVGREKGRELDSKNWKLDVGEKDKNMEFLQELIKDLRAELTKKNERLESANYRVGELEAKVKTMVPLLEFRDKEKQIDIIQVEIKNKTDQIIDITQRLNVAKSEISSKTFRLENKTSEIKNKTDQIIDINQQLNIAKVEISNQTSKIKNKESELGIKEDELKYKENELDEKTMETETIKFKFMNEAKEKRILLVLTFILSISGIIFWVLGMI